MINIRIGGEWVWYETLEDARVAATSGLGIAFWQETLETCIVDDGAWNDLLNELWQSGSESTAEYLGLIYETSARQRWVLSAIVMEGLADSQFIQAVKNASSGSVADLLEWLDVASGNLCRDGINWIVAERRHWEMVREETCSQVGKLRQLPVSSEGFPTAKIEEMSRPKVRAVEIVDELEKTDAEISSIRATLKEEYTPELADVLLNL